MPCMERVTTGWWEKTCNKCKRTFLVAAKTFDDATEEFLRLRHFTAHNCTHDGLQSCCRQCGAIKGTGLNYVQRQAKIKAQNNTCPGCHRQFSETVYPCVDHCHIHGNYREILCNDCNVALGRVRDDPNTLRRLAMIVLKHRPLPKPSVITSKKGNGYAYRKHK